MLVGRNTRPRGREIRPEGGRLGRYGQRQDWQEGRDSVPRGREGDYAVRERNQSKWKAVPAAAIASWQPAAQSPLRAVPVGVIEQRVRQQGEKRPI